MMKAWGFSEVRYMGWVCDLIRESIGFYSVRLTSKGMEFHDRY